ncbi:D-arabinose 5-phosphate isomerase [Haliovirga abyssi]|uniref:D-arabinose 5-phosphate isomerase n=1 Tax=Haliovirga abyssi TaxID=2996794 RepID=A0AAU9D3X3_9FUSO|nr:KpsF/GutQ family sugar-phosphate isomerase [Haliovirga abyssi]BDU50659.1 D-arabinose 5-phosphate isomerase [Haliovirga abyssi]
MNILKEGKKVFELEIEELNNVKDKMDNEFERAVNEIYNCKGKVILTGIGKSGLIAKKIAATLSSTGTQSIFMHSAEGIHGDLGVVRKEDLVIAISNSGNSEEVIAIMPAIKKIGAKIIGMTGNKKSYVGKNADIALDIGVKKEACPLNLAPTSSTTATLVMGDAISTVLIKMKGFKEENFALYHPGGSLGKRLLLTVEDLMHSGKELPILNLDEKIEKIILELTNKKMGAVCVVQSGEFKGIITEGDIRRALMQRDSFFKFTAKDIMNSNPISVNKDMMAIEALKIMENRESQISVLPVVESKKIVGIIRIHDLIGKVK